MGIPDSRITGMGGNVLWMKRLDSGHTARKGWASAFLAAAAPSGVRQHSCTSSTLPCTGSLRPAARRRCRKYSREDVPVTGGVGMPLATRLSHMGPRPYIIISSSSSDSSLWKERKPSSSPAADEADSSSGLMV